MTNQQTIFIVDDEATLREVVRRYLEVEGFRVLEARTGIEALDILASQCVDLILLDIMLPGLDGFSIARQLRNESGESVLIVDGDIPIIMLTSRSDEADRIAGFELGADDYVVKPFSPRELVARVKAVLRRAGNSEDKASKGDDDAVDGPLVYPNLQIDPLRRSVMVSARTVTLTAKEFDLLLLLAQHPQQVFTREQLLNRVWGYEFYGGESTVTVHIRRLREKIETDPSQPEAIQTVWGVGYKFEPF